MGECMNNFITDRSGRWEATFLLLILLLGPINNSSGLVNGKFACDN
jgi:hypothetical protein